MHDSQELPSVLEMTFAVFERREAVAIDTNTTTTQISPV